MTSEVKSVPPQATVEEVCRKMAAERVHRLLVMEKRKLLGIVTSFDIVRLLAGKGEASRAGSRAKTRRKARAK
jgi:CBS domain-containing protein